MRARLQGREAVDYGALDRSNDQWPDHRARVLVTGALLSWMKPESVVDPACGDAAVVRAAHRISPLTNVTLADLSRPTIFRVQDLIRGRQDWRAMVASADEILGAILNGGQEFDVIVLTEFLEHLEDPDSLLRLAAKAGRRLIVSSPEMRPGQIDSGPEHLWQFDGAGYEEMLNETGWVSVHKSHLGFRSMYDFQIWVCDRAS